MGAAVSLYNRYDELVRRALSNQDGKFVFDSLTPGCVLDSRQPGEFCSGAAAQYPGPGRFREPAEDPTDQRAEHH